MTTIFKLMKAYPMHITIALIFMLTELATELVLPLFMGRIIDLGIRTEDLNQTIIWGSLMIGVSLFAFVSGIINTYFAAYVAQHTGADLREKVYIKIQQFSFKNLDRFQTSSLITRLTNDVTQLERFVFMSLRIATRAPLLVIGSTVMALFVSVRLSLILLIALPLLIVFMMTLIKYGSVLFRQIQQKLDQVNKVMRENLSGIRLIKAYVREDEEAERFSKKSAALKDQTIFTLRLMDISGPVIMLVMNAAILLILFQARDAIISTQLDVGDVVAVLNYATRIMQAIGMLNWISMAYTRSKASINRINEVLDEPVDLTTGNHRLEHKETGSHLAFSSVRFRYQPDLKEALSIPHLNILKGEHVAIIGATGSGKSTFMQLIPRAYDPTAGHISLYGQALPTLTLDDLRQHIGYVPQSTQLFSGTVSDNLRFGKADATEEELILAAKDAAIHDTIMRLPHGYQTLIGQRGVNLSGGQKQRLSIARALVRQPALLLLDDATSALDLATERHILDQIKKRQATLIMVTQKISTMKQMDRILLFRDGHIEADGSHHTLLNDSTLYQTIAKSQHEEVAPWQEADINLEKK